MKKLFLLIMILSTVATSCGQFSRDAFADETIESEIEKGNFANAEQLIRFKIATAELTEEQIWDLDFKIDVMNRIRRDFSRDDSTIFAQLQKFYPPVTREMMAEWEKNRVLEGMTIDGEKRYFRNSARNVFRIDKHAKGLYEEVNGVIADKLDLFLADYIPQVVKASSKSRDGLSKPVNIKIRYSLSVKPDEVPDGEMVRVWMPYIRSNVKYKGIKLLATSQPDYIISPEDGYFHKSIYMEKRAKKGERTEFWYELSYTAYNQWFDFSPEDVKPYDKESCLYKKYTSERETHIIFSDRIKRITDSLTHSQDNPYLKARAIWDWICDNYPWASAREYSTIANIPEYVLDNNHGDCGQVGLLFITMARYAGIPARWQSGWMLHPGATNLHDWAEVYYEGIGWVGVDQSFGRVLSADASRPEDDVYYFYTKGMDAYRFIVNDDYSGDFFPAKIYPRSETVDFQRGEVEWRGGNLYFGRWNYEMKVL